jgi:hypothetical protein
MYISQLIAIRGMLNSDNKEIVREGYDLLFKLWKENLDSSDFIQQSVPIAKEHEKLVQELRTRILELSQTDSVTEKYLNDNLDILSSEISKSTSPPSKGDDSHHSDSEEEIVEKKKDFKEPKKVIPAIILIIVVLAITVNLFYVLPTDEGIVSTNLPDLKLNYKAPTYLSVRDENTLDISVYNSRQTEFEGRITLVFDDPTLVIKPALNQKFSAELDVHPQDSEPKQFRFLLTRRPHYKAIAYHFELLNSDGSQYKSAEEEFLIAPIPYARSTSNWLLATLGAVLITLIGDQLKKIATDGFGKISNLFGVSKKSI